MWPPVVVCHQLRSKDNLGSIARVMANFGLTQLILSDPVTHDFRGAERLGVGGEAILQGLAIAPSLAEALSRCVYAVGTTSRDKLKRREPVSPEDGVAALKVHATRGPVALVLGGEKRGLSDDELSLCQDVIVIPTHPTQPSMNVAQSAGVLAYLISREGAVGSPPPGPAEGARLGAVEDLERRLERLLLTAEFLNPQAPQHVLKEMTRALVRGQATPREVELWRSAVVHLERAVGQRVSAGPSSR